MSYLTTPLQYEHEEMIGGLRYLFKLFVVVEACQVLDARKDELCVAMMFSGVVILIVSRKIQSRFESITQASSGEA
jgi:hypothetical protein